MKKLIMFMLPVFALLSACEPVTKDIKMGGVLTADQIDIKIENVTPGSNSVVLRCLTPGISGKWEDLSGIGIVEVGADVPIIMAALGETRFKFTAFCDGGTVTKETSVTIDKIDVIPDEWIPLVGSNATVEGKTWVWDGTYNDTSIGQVGNCYGNGGYGHSKTPNWNYHFVGQTAGQPESQWGPAWWIGLVDPDGTMVFDLKGGTNLTTSDVNVGTVKGTFKLDMTDKIDGYSVGTLTLTGVTVMLGKAYAASMPDIYVYQVVKLDKDQMVLSYAFPGAVIYDPNWATTATIWVFKAAE